MENEITELILCYLSYIIQKTEISPTLDINDICKELKRQGYITEQERFRLGE